MLDVQHIDHIGIRISDRAVSTAFYEKLGFATVTDAGFDQGHPIIMRHPSGVTLNLLGPSTAGEGTNILMDVSDKHPGITHFALHVRSLEDTKAFLAREGIAIHRVLLLRPLERGLHPRPGPHGDRTRRPDQCGGRGLRQLRG